jgi:transposase
MTLLRQAVIQRSAPEAEHLSCPRPDALLGDPIQVASGGAAGPIRYRDRANRFQCPSGIRPAADRVKTDRRDAERLARLLRLGEITPVRVPGPEEEAARDLVRAREDARGDLMRARHRLSKLLLRHGLVYDATAWTRAHDAWLRRQRFPSGPLAVVFDECYGRMLDAKTRRDALDKAISELAARAP